MEIGVDFDGTCVVHEFPKVGKDIGAAPVLRDLVRAGHRLILNTMRSDVDFETNTGKMPAGEHLTEAKKWFEDNGIELYAVHTNPEQHEWTTSPKCYAKLYIDDAALGCPLVNEQGVRPYVDWDRVRNILVESGVLPACAIAADGRHIGIEEVCRRVCVDCHYDGPETGLDSCTNCGHRYEPKEGQEDCPECFCTDNETHCPKCDSTDFPYYGDYKAMIADGTIADGFMSIYITFGQEHRHTVNGEVFDKDCVAEIECGSYEHGRERAFELFGPKFATSYSGAEVHGVMHHFPRGIIHVPLKAPQTEKP